MRQESQTKRPGLLVEVAVQAESALRGEMAQKTMPETLCLRRTDAETPVNPKTVFKAEGQRTQDQTKPMPAAENPNEDILSCGGFCL